MYNSADLFRKRLSAYVEPHGGVTEFAEKAGLSRGVIDKWLAKEKPSCPKLDYLDKVAEAMGADPWDLIRPEAEQTPEDRFYAAQAAFAQPGMRPLSVEQLKRFMRREDELLPAEDLRSLGDKLKRNEIQKLTAEWAHVLAHIPADRLQAELEALKKIYSVPPKPASSHERNE